MRNEERGVRNFKRYFLRLLDIFDLLDFLVTIS